MQKKQLWVRFINKILKIFFRKPEVIYLGEEIPESSLILCNHVGAAGPAIWHMHMDNFRCWATHEITEGTVSVYKYLSGIFFSQKKHWNKAVSNFVSFFAAPFVALFVSTWELIPSYKDMRFARTLRETVESLKKKCSVLIFPEDSSQGYHDELTSLHPGFCMAGETAFKNGIDADMVFAYLIKGKRRRLIIDSPVKFSMLKEQFDSREAFTEYACRRINELRSMLV